MPGLAFDAIDRHVIDGGGDELCFVNSERSASYVDLLSESAAIAGGLKNVGAVNAESIAIALQPSWERLAVLAAMLRLSMAPNADSRISFAGDPAQLHFNEDVIELDTIIRIGRVDPHAAQLQSDEELLEQFSESDRTWIGILLGGGTITIE